MKNLQPCSAKYIVQAYHQMYSTQKAFFEVLLFLKLLPDQDLEFQLAELKTKREEGGTQLSLKVLYNLRKCAPIGWAHDTSVATTRTMFSTKNCFACCILPLFVAVTPLRHLGLNIFFGLSLVIEALT